MAIAATAQLTILDLNDTLRSDTAPGNPELNMLWIDTSVTPNQIKSWNGTTWINQTLSVEQLDPEFEKEVSDLKAFAANASSDGILTTSEKLNVKLLLVQITGDSLTGTVLPTLAAIDTAKGGQVYMARAEALAAGLLTTHADYIALGTSYTNLKTYLDGLTPRPWLTGNTTIDSSTWTSKWDDYYDKLAKLTVTTSTYLANSLKPGIPYNGVTMESVNGVVVTSSTHKLILNATSGITIQKTDGTKQFYTHTDGKIYATGLVIGSESTINGTDVSTVVSNASAGKTAKDTVDKVTTTENNTTVIDGGKIKTGSVVADKLNVKGLTVSNGTKNTFVVSPTGEVTIDGTLYINSSSNFAEGYDPSKTGGGRNIVLNSRFSAEDFSNWNDWGVPTVKVIEGITDLPGFDKAFKVTTSNTNQGISQTVATVIGQTYTMSTYVKSSAGQPVLQAANGQEYPTAVMPLANVATNKWVKISKVFIANTTSTQIRLGRSALGSIGTYWFTGAKLEEGDKVTGWTPAQEDVDKMLGALVEPDGTIKANDIASSIAVTPGAIQFISDNIKLSGRVTFQELSQGWALDENGNKISNSDQADYDPNNPLYMDMDGYYRPLDDEKYFLSNLFMIDPGTGTTVINGSYIQTGTIQAKDANFMNVEVFNDTGEKTFSIDTDGNLATVGTSKSAGYEPGLKGWKIDNDGSAEFNSAVFRGDIELGYFDETANEFVQTGGVQSGTDASGRALRFWAGKDADSAPFKVYSDGSLYATEGNFNGTFSGVVQVGNITIKDNPDISGDASIVLTDDLLIEKINLSESKAVFNTDTVFGNFMTINLKDQNLEFGDGTFKIDYQQNLIQMKSFAIKGGESLELISEGSAGNDFVFSSLTGDASAYVDGSFSVRDNVEFSETLVMKTSRETGNKGVDFIFV